MLGRSSMEVATGIVKHVLLAKFNDGISPQKIDEIITEWANLVNVIGSFKDFDWGTDVSLENKAEGFTHVFVCTFESTEGVTEYFYHPAHVEFAQKCLPFIERHIVIDYKPTKVKL